MRFRKILFCSVLCFVLLCDTSSEAINSNIIVSLNSPSLLVVEGNVFSVCIFAMSEPMEDYVVQVEPILHFFTADRGDLSPVDQITPIVLRSDRPYGCFDFQALPNDDGNRFSETLALTINQSDSFSVSPHPAKTYITIVETVLKERISAPSVVNVKEGNFAVVCVKANSTEPIVLSLTVEDISADASTDYSRTSIPDSIVLSSTQPVKCLRILTFTNEDGHNETESFRLTFSKSLDIFSPVKLYLASVLIFVHKECQDGELRLVNGSRNGEGVVEICSNGRYSIVCGTNWTAETTDVVCRQAGYYLMQDTSFRLIAGEEGVQNAVQCQAKEDFLANCSSVSITTGSCSAVQVQCVPDCPSGTTCPVPCQLNELECPMDGRCLEMKYICDGIPDCVIDSNKILDEQKCSAPGCPEEGGVNLPLVGGTSNQHGLVEVCVGGDYYPVSLSNFGVEEASVLCRSAGLSAVGFPLSAVEDFGLNLNRLFRQSMEYLVKIQCSGAEYSLSQCILETVNFDDSTADVAAVQCVETVRCSNCSNGDIRLVSSNGPSLTEGRVEVFYEGVWGAIFDPDWTALDAAVVCKELGHNPKGALPFIQATFPSDAKFLPVLYDSPACDSDMYGSILECPRAGWFCVLPDNGGVRSGSGSGIGNGEEDGDSLVGILGRLTNVGWRDRIGYVGVKCEEYPPSGCAELDVRLAYRDQSNASGNLEICYSGLWTAVCSELFSTSDLQVACWALGYSENEDTYRMGNSFLNDTVLAFRKTLNCIGSEQTLADCPGSIIPMITCTSVQIQCSVHPQLYVIPRPLNGSLTVREGRSARVECVAAGPGQKGSLAVTELRGPTGEMRSGINIAPLCLSTPLYETNSAQLNDSGTYVCEAYVDSLNTSFETMVTIQIQKAEGEAIHHFIRFSTLNSQQRTLLFAESMNASCFEDIILKAISSNFPGVHAVDCYEVNSTITDMERRLSRLECVITEFATSSSNKDSLIDETSVVLETFYLSIVLFLTSSEVGFCNFDQTIFEGVTYLWRESERGTVISQRCPDKRISGQITRVCGADRVWSEPDTSACTVAMEILQTVLKQNVNAENVVEVTSTVNLALEVTVRDATQQTEEVLSSMATFFTRVTDLVQNISNGTVSPKVMDGLVSSIGSLQQWQTSTIATNPQLGNSIIMNFQTVSAQFAANLPESMPFRSELADQVIFEAENVLISEAGDMGRQFLAINRNITTGSAFLPPSLFQDIGSRSTIGVVFTAYSESTFFPLRDSTSDNNTRKTIVASPVLSSTVGNTARSGLEPPVEIKLIVYDDGLVKVNGSERCVFWDFKAAGGKGNWSTEGCTLKSVNNEVVTCHCNHLTNFAVLIDICSRLDDCENIVDPTLTSVLSYITYVGVALSMAGVTITVVTMTAFKKLRDHDVTKFHIQLCLSIFAMLLVFVSGVDRASLYVPCLLASLLLHYFTLTSVVWMGAEAVFMFRKFIFVFRPVTSKFLVVTSLICWLSPLPFVLVPLIVDLTGKYPDDLLIRRNELCFLSNALVFFLTLLVPVLMVVLFNIALFVIVMVVLVRHFRSSSLRKKKEQKRRTSTVRLMISILGIMFLFGLSWAFAAFTVTVQEIRLPAQILFTVFSSFQGFAIFIFFCVLSREARESWKEFLSCGKYTSKFLHPSKFAFRSTDHRIHAAGMSTSSTLNCKTFRTLKLDTDIKERMAKPTTDEALTMTMVSTCPSEGVEMDSRLDNTSMTDSLLTPTVTKLTSSEDLEIPPATPSEKSSKSDSSPSEQHSLTETPPCSEEESESNPTAEDLTLKIRITRTTTIRRTHDVEEARLDFKDDTDESSEA